MACCSSNCLIYPSLGGKGCNERTVSVSKAITDSPVSSAVTGRRPVVDPTMPNVVGAGDGPASRLVDHASSSSSSAASIVVSVRKERQWSMRAQASTSSSAAGSVLNDAVCLSDYTCMYFVAFC